MISKDRAWELYNYSPETGIFTHKKKRGVLAGSVAGSPHNRGYITIGCDRRAYLAHRLAWLMIYGAFPEKGMDIDHIDGDRTNNKIENLRLASRKDNLKNAVGHKDSVSGVKGVSWAKKEGKWQVRFYRSGKSTWLGLHDNLEYAKQVHEDAVRKYDGEFYKPT